MEARHIVFEGGIINQKQAFDRIAALLADVAGVTEADIVDVLGEREQMGTTGFGGGAAIPHGRLAGAKGLHAAILRLQKPIDWKAMDGNPVDLLVALVGPDEASAEYLQALALISRTLREESTMRKLRGAADPDALWAMIAHPQKKAA